MFYTPTDLIEMIIDDIGLGDLPIIEDIGIESLLKRIQTSSLKTFSTYYPHKIKLNLYQDYLMEPNVDNMNTVAGIIYEIPKDKYEGMDLLGVVRINTTPKMGYNDQYVPSVYSFAPDAVIGTVAAIKMSADLGRHLSKAMTWEWIRPNKIKVFNGWVNGVYEIELMATHDQSFSTIPPTAFESFKELCTLDLKQYIYNRYKRLQNLEVGIGAIELKLDDMSDAGEQKKELIRRWDEEGSSLDIDYMYYF